MKNSLHLPTTDSSSMILKVTSQETRRSLTSWRNLSWSEVSGNPFLRGFTQFGAHIVDASGISMPFMMLNRLCIATPSTRGRILEAGEENLLKLNRNKGNYLQSAHPNSGLTMSTVPIIAVFTKFDLFVASLAKRSKEKGEINVEFAEERFKRKHSQAFEKATHDILGKAPYTTVASTFTSENASLAFTSSYSFTPRYFAAPR